LASSMHRGYQATKGPLAIAASGRSLCLARTRIEAGLCRRLTARAFQPRTLHEITEPTAHEGSLLSAAQSYSTLKVELAVDGVCSVLLDRPSKQNAANMPMWEELIDCFNIASEDPAVRACILGSTSAHFCSGMDLSVFAAMKRAAREETCPGRVRERVLKSIAFFQRGASAPEHCAKPVLAAVDGNAIGAGVDILTACDLRYCTQASRLSVKEVDLGIVADLGTMQRLPHLVGDQRARELTYTGRTFSGDEAVRYGLCLEPAFDDAQAMMAHVRATASAIAAKSPITVRGCKRVALYTRDHPTDDALNHVAIANSAFLHSEDLDEAMAAMGERRAPNFRSA